jgi:hypothetical protein
MLGESIFKSYKSGVQEHLGVNGRRATRKRAIAHQPVQAILQRLYYCLPIVKHSAVALC